MSKNIEQKKNNVFKNILLILIFLGLGLYIGVYVTNKYLSSQDKDEIFDINDEWPLEITNKKDYNEQITALYRIVQGNQMFYSSFGVSYKGIDAGVKLVYIYNYLTNNNVGEIVNLESTYYGSSVCEYDFLTDDPETEYTISTRCTVMRINKSDFSNVAVQLFNDSELNTSVDFVPIDGKKCVADGDSYLCGNINAITGITGDLEAKFEIIKVTLDKDGTIRIYDKGYLIDRRSNIIGLNDGYDNHYLHSSDSSSYYYELKSADNLTFEHTFNKDENGKYYYVSSIVSN